MFPYAAEHEDELELHEGDIITVLCKELEDKGWWKGELNGNVGVFPDNFVELLSSEEMVNVVPASGSDPDHSLSRFIGAVSSLPWLIIYSWILAYPTTLASFSFVRPHLYQHSCSNPFYCCCISSEIVVMSSHVSILTVLYVGEQEL